MACVASGFLFLGGALLALATIKPQLAWPLVAWLLLWAVSDWRVRRKLVLGFGLVMVLLLAGAEIVLPGWWRMFAEAIAQYHQYTQNQSVLEVILNGVLGPFGGGTVGRVGGQILAVHCYPRVCSAVTEVATRASRLIWIQRCNGAGACFDRAGGADVRTLQSGSAGAGNFAAGTGTGSVCVAVTESPSHVPDGRASSGMAVGRESRL